jgi:hypothetical protein
MSKIVQCWTAGIERPVVPAVAGTRLKYLIFTCERDILKQQKVF